MTSFSRSVLSALIATSLCHADIQVPSGTKISCRLEQSLSSATAEEGQPVTLTVTEEVQVDGVVVFPQGSEVVGSVLTATAKRRMGRTGKLDFSIDKARAADGKFIPVRYTVNKREGGSHAMSTGVITAGVAVLFWPAAPFVLLRKGKDVVINKGIVLEVFTDQDHRLASAEGPASPQVVAAAAPVVRAATPVAAPTPTSAVPIAGSAPSRVAPSVGTIVPVAAAASPAPVREPSPPAAVASALPIKISITSEPSGAEISIDGKFFGSTPTQSSPAPGDHSIKITKRGYTPWERVVTINAGDSISVNAELDKAPAAFKGKVNGLN